MNILTQYKKVSFEVCARESPNDYGRKKYHDVRKGVAERKSRNSGI